MSIVITDEVTYERLAHVAIVTLNASERRNALTAAMATRLVEICDEIDQTPDVGAVVLRGGGGYFCAGADRGILAAAGEDPMADPAHHNIGLVYGAFIRVGELQPPTVAAIRGGAVGAGLNLALATDVRLIAEEARLTSGFVRLGLHPGGGYFALSGRTAGREATAAMGLFGETIDGRRAAELGLAWKALPDEEVEQYAMRMADQMGSDAQLARRAARSFRQTLGPPAAPWPITVDAERAAQAWSLRRRAGGDGMAAHG